MSLYLNGTAFLDTDGDGFLSPGENGFANVTVRLMEDAGEISNAITDESGQYFFANLSPDRYELYADPLPGGNLTAPGAGYHEVTLSDKPGFGLDFGFFAPTDLTAAPLLAREYPLMRPTLEEASQWAGQYNASAQAYLSPEIAAQMEAAPGISYSLLDLLEYTPSERDQGYCGNCWAWAGTGVMEIDYARQMGVSDRFSVQYLDSNYNGGCGTSGACCGGWLENLASFYRGKGMIIPWSNANAHYRDGGRGCGGCSAVSASSISTSPHYDLEAISTSTISSRGLAKEVAISNIKNVLGQGKAIWFAFFLPDSGAWDSFYRFWGYQPESTVWQPDFAAGSTYSYNSGGGHAVLCVGYDDTDPNNRYWIMLNSWGTTTGRPTGLFRMNMDMNYDCAYRSLGYAFYWMTLDMSYQESENNPPETPSLPQGPEQGSVRNSLIYTTSTVDPDGDPVSFTFDWGDGSSSQTGLVSSGRGTASHIWSQSGTYLVAAKAIDSRGDSSDWSDDLEVTIAAANQPPLRPSTPQGPTTGNLGSSYSYTSSAIDPDGDDVQLTFDWGDASQSVTNFAQSSEVISASHTWPRSGTYYVRAKAIDSKGGQSSSSSYCQVKISDTSNRPPRTPGTPSGVGIGFVGKSYSYLGYASDPDRDQIFYTFDWGDGNTTQTDLVNSGRSM
ncbi:MAG: PKD domain-containing protein, partial [Methanotrichaceae archaeon]|nr:PKD domain-containing protein [Methanotrichaceae archaeon]